MTHLTFIFLTCVAANPLSGMLLFSLAINCVTTNTDGTSDIHDSG